jgi:hypothetical protein
MQEAIMARRIPVRKRKFRKGTKLTKSHASCVKHMKGKVRDPAAFCAEVGRSFHGFREFQKKAERGRKRAAKKRRRGRK